MFVSAQSAPTVVHEMTMRHLRNLKAVITVTGFILYATAATAHDVWLTLAGDAGGRRVVINYGHPDDRPPPFADKVVDLDELLFRRRFLSRALRSLFHAVSANV